MSTEARSIGPYRLLELLGQGSMSAVYRAEHLRSGRLVALKTVQAPWAALLPLIRREIHALGRLQHPGVVQILDSGTYQGVPWYAMELLEGPTLRGHARRIELWRPEELFELLGLVRRLCTALAYVHGEGIVHRDLKPDNVLLRIASSERAAGSERDEQAASGRSLASRDPRLAASCWPVLVDFGVLAEWPGAAGRETMDLDATGAGTPLYVAPEQLRGDLVDARADLYSLGCLLYELLAGRPPFEGSVAEVCEAQLHAEPRPLSELVPWVPAPLEALVLRLLAKEPRQRLGYATDVAVALAELGAHNGAEEARPEPRAYLYRPGFVGRARTLEALEGRLARLEAGEGAVLLVGGESGVGKTRLLMELELRARARGIRVLTGECLPGQVESREPGVDREGKRPGDGVPLPSPISDLPSGSGSARVARGRSRRSPSMAAASGPLEALRRPLRALGDLCRQQGRAGTQRLLGRSGRLLAEYEPSLLELPGVGEAPEPVELPAEAARLRLFDALAESFTALARRKPLLLALDDLQWADELTWGWLEFLVRRAEAGASVPTSLLVVGTYRSEEAGAALERLARSPRTVHLALERLGEEPLGAMAGEMLALEKPSERFVRFLARRCSGNPFFVGEYLRAAVAEGVLYRDEQGRWQVAEKSEEPATEAVYEALPLPGSIRELVVRRLAGLAADARRLADVASVFGREVEAEVLGRAVRMREERRMEALGELLARQVLEEPEPGRLRFVHDQIREAAYGRLVKTRRRRLHEAAARAVEACFGAQSEAHQAALGEHWEQAKSFERARDCYLAAARHAMRRYAHGEAERLYGAYFALVAQPTAESITARNELAAQVLQFQGRTDRARSEMMRAVEEAKSLAHLPLQAASLFQLAALYQKTGRIDEGRELCVEVLAIVRRLGDPEGEGRVLRLLGSIEYEQSRPEKALAAYQTALAISRQYQDRQTEVMTLTGTANVYSDQGRLAESAGLHQQALALAAELGLPWLEGIVLGNFANVCLLQGRLGEARALYERALAIHREAGRRASEGIVLSNLASVYRLQGDLKTAEQLLDQALSLDRAVGNRRGESIHLTLLAMALQDNGHLEPALAALQRALALARQIRDRRTESCALFEESRLRRRSSELPLAAELLDSAEAILTEFEDRLGIAECLIERGHIALASGVAPCELLEQARELVARAAVAPQSELGCSLARLERAIEMHKAGQALLNGESAADLPEGLRRRLGESSAFQAANGEGQQPRP